MKRFFQILVFLIAVGTSSASAQTSPQRFNIQVPREGFPINVQKLPEIFPESLVVFIAIDLEDIVAPADVEVSLIGPNLTDEFKLSSQGAQRNYSASQLSGDIEIIITKAGYKTIKTKLKIEGRSAVAIRLDKEDTTQQISYKVGDYYNDGTKEGVVFYVDATGQHGKIVSLDEYWMQWCTDVQYDKKISVGATSKTDGKSNTDKVMARADYKEYSAFCWCRNKGKDWYLPAIDELKLLLLNDSVHDTVNCTLESRSARKLSNRDTFSNYWSSSEYNGLSAWNIRMDYDSPYDLDKISYNTVRAVATF